MLWFSTAQVKFRSALLEVMLWNAEYRAICYEYQLENQASWWESLLIIAVFLPAIQLSKHILKQEKLSESCVLFEIYYSALLM